jgi:uncharacterized membrane protein
VRRPDWLTLPGSENALVRPGVAFVAVFGPLLGADLLHLSVRDPQRACCRLAERAFDGIVLSGILAALIA